MKNTRVRVKAFLSYPNLLRPRAQNEQAPKYSVTLLLPKKNIPGDPADYEGQIKAIKAAIEAAHDNGVEKYGKKPFKSSVPFYDGADEKYAEKNPEYADYWLINSSANADSPPVVVDNHGRVITADSPEASEVYAGKWAWVTVNPYPYSRDEKKGIAFGLNGVMVLPDVGPLGRLDNRASFDEMFGDLVEAVTADDAEQDDALTSEFQM